MGKRITLTLAEDGLKISIPKEYVGNILQCEGGGCCVWYRDGIYSAEGSLEVKESFYTVLQLLGEDNG